MKTIAGLRKTNIEGSKKSLGPSPSQAAGLQSDPATETDRRNMSQNLEHRHHATILKTPVECRP